MKKKIIGAALGNCVHIGGVVHFLQLAEREGYETVFLGPAVSVDRFIEEIKAQRPTHAAVGYRLTPDNCRQLLDDFCARVRAEGLDKTTTFVFGGIRPNAELARACGLFSYISDGSDDIDDSLAFLRGLDRARAAERWPQTIVGRIEAKYPYPVLRHHVGLPSLEDTVAGIARIAEAKVLDVISIGPDQNTQQFFFRPSQMDPAFDGAGGVPLRTEEDFRRLKAAAQTGNYPLLRCYSGTDDVLKFAQLLDETIGNAWCAVPLCWYNELDGRGTRTIDASVVDAQALMRWHAARGIPVEMNEPHHWGLRDAHDVLPVVTSFLAAYNARACGVRDYIAQYMFNNPAMLSFNCDLARVLAMLELTETLAGDDFRIYRQTRAGLPFLSGDLDVAKGQLAATTYLQLAVRPHIIHVVGYSEAEKAATPDIVIESCRIVRGVIRSALDGAPDLTADAAVQARKRQLLEEAKYTLDFIKRRYAGVSADPFADPAVIADCVKKGILDAPHIVKNERFTGNLVTRMIDGHCAAVDEEGRELTEAQRIGRLRLGAVLDAPAAQCRAAGH
ncbi:MAG: methionine synthase [Oscillospiraceae bacterium]|nr:methionine synthase [Oscillospiraceae bacterium]